MPLQPTITERTKFGYPLHERKHLAAEFLLNNFRLYASVLDRVVEKSCCYRVRVDANLGEEIADFCRMHEIRVSRKSLLIFVCLLREFICFGDESDVTLALTRHRAKYVGNWPRIDGLHEIDNTAAEVVDNHSPHALFFQFVGFVIRTRFA